MSEAKTAKPVSHPEMTTRKDNWWLEPLLIATGFTAFIIYATYRVFENGLYEYNQYLSPFYSPHFEFEWWHFSPAILILWIPAGFRATCYYYRKAYYRSYFLTPPACAVDMHGPDKYTGETKFPLVFQNMHRYFFYLAVVVLVILYYDAVKSLMPPNGGFSLSVLSLVMFANCILLSNYTFGCHAYRHLCGGCLNSFSDSPRAKSRFQIWNLVTKLNLKHQFWAWMSLFSVAFTDFYIRQVCAGSMDPFVFLQF